MVNYREHRKTLVKKDKWPLIDGWYWCPESAIEHRVKRLGDDDPLDAGWMTDQYHQLNERLAHACKDGRIRAGVGIQEYKKKSGMLSLYGKCKKCDEKLSDGVKTIILMELTL